jgi:glutamate-1-semialdehyde 2,1-aminomutase
MQNCKMNRENSQKYFEEAQNYFPGGVHSPVRAFKSVEGPPAFIRKGQGPFIWDVDDNRYLDFCCSWGPLILGHDDAHVRKAIIEAVENGTSFGTPTYYDLEVGRLLLGHNKKIEKVRFVSSGTEAVMSAIRLARGYTGRQKIVKFEGCYHGHVDALMVKAGSGLVTFGESTSAGISKGTIGDTLVLPLDNEEAIEQVFKTYGEEIAAVIIEPIPANNGLLLQRKEYLTFLRETTQKWGSLLIFDEVISGFRVGFEGAAGYYDLQPDIITYGKIIGGGMPVGAYGGSKEIMSCVAPEGPVYQAGTLSANPVAMAAGHATMSKLIQPEFYNKLSAKTKNFSNILQNHMEEKGYEASIVSIGSIFWLSFSKDTIRRADQIEARKMGFFRSIHSSLMQRGIYLGPSGYEVGFVSSAHEASHLEEAAEKIIRAMDLAFSNPPT